MYLRRVAHGQRRGHLDEPLHARLRGGGDVVLGHQRRWGRRHGEEQAVGSHHKAVGWRLGPVALCGLPLLFLLELLLLFLLPLLQLLGLLLHTLLIGHLGCHIERICMHDENAQ